MNPILKHLNRLQNPPQQERKNEEVSSLISGIQNGTINPKDEVLRRIENSSPQMKAKLKMALPMVGALAKKYGFASSDVESFTKALQDKL